MYNACWFLEKPCSVLTISGHDRKPARSRPKIITPLLFMWRTSNQSRQCSPNELFLNATDSHKRVRHGPSPRVETFRRLSHRRARVLVEAAPEWARVPWWRAHTCTLLPMTEPFVYLSSSGDSYSDGTFDGGRRAFDIVWFCKRCRHFSERIEKRQNVFLFFKRGIHRLVWQAYVYIETLLQRNVQENHQYPIRVPNVCLGCPLNFGWVSFQ